MKIILKSKPGILETVSLEVQGTVSSIFELSGEKFDIIVLAIPIYDLERYLRQIDEANLSTSYLILPNPALIDNKFVQNLPRNRKVLRAVSRTVAVWENTESIKLLFSDRWYMGNLLPRNLQKSTKAIIDRVFRDDVKVIEHYNRFTSYVWTYNILYSALFYPALIFNMNIDLLIENKYTRKIIEFIINEGKRTARLHGVQVSLGNNDVYEFARKLRGVKSPVLYFWNRKLPSEVDYFNGAISRLSEWMGEQAIVNNLLYLIIKGLEAKLDLVQ